MVPGDFQALSVKRAERARALAERYPAAREVLDFYREIALFETTVRANAPLEARARLIELVIDKGPELLRGVAQRLDEASCRSAIEHYMKDEDTTSPRSFFARVLLQPQVARREWSHPVPVEDRCPRCGHLPQVGCLRPRGDGLSLSLVCSLCLFEWTFPRGRCPSCGETREDKIAYYAADELPHLQVQACDTCARYVHLVNLSKDPEAIPDVDEIAALALDVWAYRKGYRKLHPNLVGI